MVTISWESLVSRSVVRLISRELDLAGSKMKVDTFFSIMIIGAFLLLIGTSYVLYLAFHFFVVFAAIIGLFVGGLYVGILYLILEFQIEKRKTFVEEILPDYLQLTAANVRSGVPLDKALTLSSRPEFKYFSNDVKAVSEQVYSGETIENALNSLAEKYRSTQLKHTIRLITESIQYGGGIVDLLNQVSKDVRNQQMIQKEISSQLFMYTLFIVFAALIGAPTLYALTAQMINITGTVWQGIQSEYPGGALPTQGVSFLKPNPPQINLSDYTNFAFAAILIISAFCAFIVSAIQTGNITSGIKYAPAFIVLAFVIYFGVSIVMGGIFSNITGGI